MTRYVLILSANPALASRLLAIDADGRVLARTHVDDAAPPAWPAAPVTVLVPATDTSVFWLDLPTRHPAQARAAARLQMADRLAGSMDATHIAVAPTGTGLLLVVAVEHAAVAGWRARFARLGLGPACVLPDALAMPADDQVRVRMEEGDWIVRGPGLAFRAEAALAARVLAGHAFTHLDGSDADALVAAGTVHPAIDLLQGDHATASPTVTGWAAWRRAGVLGGLLLASPFVLLGAEALRANQQAGQLEARADALARTVLPVVDPRTPAARQLQRALEQRRAAERLPHLAATLATQVPGLAGGQVEMLEIGDDGLVRIALAHAEAADLQPLRAAIEALGYDVTLGDARRLDRQVVSELLAAPAKVRP